MSKKNGLEKNENQLRVVHIRIGRQKEIVNQEDPLPQRPRRVTSQRRAVSAHFLEDGSPSRAWPCRVTSWTAGHFPEGRTLPGRRPSTPPTSWRTGRRPRVALRRMVLWGHFPQGVSLPRGRVTSRTATLSPSHFPKAKSGSP